MKTVRRPPYPKWNPGYFPCSSLTPLPLSSRRPSVSFGGFGLTRRRWDAGWRRRSRNGRTLGSKSLEQSRRPSTRDTGGRLGGALRPDYPAAPADTSAAQIKSVHWRPSCPMPSMSHIRPRSSRTRYVDGQRKCPPKWPAKMSLELLAMVSGHSVLTVGRFIGGLSACMYFFAVSRWMASSRATLRIDRPLRFAFCTAFHLAV